MIKLELDLLKLCEGKSLEFAADYAAIIPQIIEVLKTQNTPESFEQAYSEIFSPIVKRPYPRLENGDYKYIEIDQGWKLWQAATAQAVPEGFVLVPKNTINVLEELTQLSSYAEIVGGISVNRAAIRGQCDIAFNLIREFEDTEFL